MAITKWDPFRDLLNLQNEMTRVFGRAYGEETEGTRASWAPRMPGVTIANVRPQRRRMISISCGDATTPSKPHDSVSAASRPTCEAIASLTPMSLSAC